MTVFHVDNQPIQNFENPSDKAKAGQVDRLFRPHFL